MEWVFASDIKKEISRLIKSQALIHLFSERIFCFRSFGSKSRAYARIWSFPRIWQKALGVKPAYCIEVISKKFDKLSPEEKEKVLIHELNHIPKNFSGTLLGHRR